MVYLDFCVQFTLEGPHHDFFSGASCLIKIQKELGVSAQVDVADQRTLNSKENKRLLSLHCSQAFSLTRVCTSFNYRTHSDEHL